MSKTQQAYRLRNEDSCRSAPATFPTSNGTPTCAAIIFAFVMASAAPALRWGKSTLRILNLNFRLSDALRARETFRGKSAGLRLEGAPRAAVGVAS